ncbi:MAG: SUMF1/EgtB/PvdO family nonheme iron enzyme [Pseudomonadota bacterium]
MYATQGASKITSVKADLSSLNLGAALLADDGTGGDTVKNDTLYSCMITLAADVKPGTYTLPVAAHAEAGVQANGSVTLSVKQGYTVPELTSLQIRGSRGHIPVLFNLIDPDKDICSVKVEYKREGGPWLPASIESASGVVNADTAKKEGGEHAAPKNVLARIATPLAVNPCVLVWQSEKDMGNETGIVSLRLTPQDGKTQGREASSAPFHLDNGKPLADEMVYVPSGKFSIDKYEYPNHFGYYPAANITWHEARKACQEKGKDLCTAGQWEAAYYGSAKKRYPYGDVYGFEGRAFCNTQGSADDVPAPSGLYENCVNDLGVYDMGGNLYEWVGHDEKNSLMADQSYKTEAMVQSLFNSDEAAHRHEYLGFRCCSCEEGQK